MIQGCSGNPFTVLDGPEVMVAYQGPEGMIPTPTWEAIRDGINDYKYIYQLKRLIAAEKQKGNAAALHIEQELEELKKNLGLAPGFDEGQYGDWTPNSFEQRRKQIVAWALELSQSGQDRGVDE